jgi:hypothetical protein
MGFVALHASHNPNIFLRITLDIRHRLYMMPNENQDAIPSGASRARGDGSQTDASQQSQ